MRTLASAAIVILASFAVTLGWFALTGDPMGGEPWSVTKVENPNVGEQILAKKRALQQQQSLPQQPQTQQQPKPEAPAQPLSQTDPKGQPEQQRALKAPPGIAVAMLEPPRQQPSPQQMPLPQRLAPMAAVQSEPAQLGPVPADGLVQESRYGPLPRIAQDGRRPSVVYSRPTRYPTLPQQGEPVRIAILINGMGLSEAATNLGIAKLPAPVTLGFGAYGRNLQASVKQARDAGHEVMLQIPLEPFDYPDNDPGPHTLLTNLPAEENLKRLYWLMARFTGYAGVTNHMGGKFAATQESFLPMLEEMRKRGLIYVDDGASSRSAGGKIARDIGLGYSTANVTIDASQSAEDIDKALAKLEVIAREKGLAIGVGGTLPLTIERVAKWAQTLQGKNIVLIPISAAVHAQHSS